MFGQEAELIRYRSQQHFTADINTHSNTSLLLIINVTDMSITITIKEQKLKLIVVCQPSKQVPAAFHCRHQHSLSNASLLLFINATDTSITITIKGQKLKQLSDSLLNRSQQHFTADINMRSDISLLLIISVSDNYEHNHNN